LFDTLYAFENYPVEAAGPDRRPGGLEITGVSSREAPGYPLSLVVTPGSRLGLRLVYDRQRFSEAGVRRLAEQLQLKLAAMVAGPDRPVVGLPEVDVATGRELVRWNRTGREWRWPMSTGRSVMLGWRGGPGGWRAGCGRWGCARATR
jgi:hypothetical protein